MSLVQRTTVVGISSALVLLVLMVYAPVREHEFLNEGDPQHVTRVGLSWAGVGAALSEVTASGWHPLATLSHMLDSTLFGSAPESAGQ